jgi:hypothetical protein
LKLASDKKISLEEMSDDDNASDMYDELEGM